MKKNIIIQSMSTPDLDGYHDKLLVEKDGKTEKRVFIVNAHAARIRFDLPIK